MCFDREPALVVCVSASVLVNDVPCVSIKSMSGSNNVQLPLPLSISDGDIQSSDLK